MSTNDQKHEMTMNALREAALTRSTTDYRQSACLTDDVLVAFADGRLRNAEVLASTPHLSSCRRCQHELASLVRALNDPDVARAVRAGERGRLRVAGMLFPLAAAAATIIVLVIRPEPQLPAPERQHRAPVLTPGGAPMAVSPVGPVSRVVDLRWSTVPHADVYLVTLFDTDGRVLFEAEADEPSMTLPDWVKLAPAQRYLWQVQARIGFDRWVSSDLVAFRLISPQP